MLASGRDWASNLVIWCSSGSGTEHLKQWQCSEIIFQTSLATCVCNMPKKTTVSAFPGGFKHWAVRTLELLAFLPDPLFHVAVQELLRRLELAGQTKAVDYLKNSKSPCAVYTEKRGVALSLATQFCSWHIRIFSTFLNNTVESSWAVADVVNGKTQHNVTHSIFNNVQRSCNTWAINNHFETLSISFVDCRCINLLY